MKISKQTNIGYAVIMVFLTISLLKSNVSLIFLLFPTAAYLLTLYGAHLIEKGRKSKLEDREASRIIHEIMSTPDPMIKYYADLEREKRDAIIITEDADYEIVQPKQIENK